MIKFYYFYYHYDEVVQTGRPRIESGAKKWCGFPVLSFRRARFFYREGARKNTEDLIKNSFPLPASRENRGLTLLESRCDGDIVL